MQHDRTALVRTMSQWDTFGLAFGAMIGWGWVVLASGWISIGGILGSAVAFVAGAVMCSAVSFVYAELTSAMPVAGGPVAFAFRGLGDGWAWLTGWTVTFAYMNVAAWESVAITTALNYIIPIPKILRLWTVAGQDVYLGWALTGAIIGLSIALLNYRGTKLSSLAQNLGTILLVAAGVLFVATSALKGSKANFSPLWTTRGGVASVLMMVPFMMVGFDVIPQSAEEANIPHRNIGRLLMISVYAATFWYVSIILGLGYAIPATLRDSSPMAVGTAMETLLRSPLAGKTLALGGVCGILTSWNAFFMAASRVLFAMGRAKMLPPSFAAVEQSSGVPTTAVILVGSVCLIAPFLGSNALMWMANVGGLCTCVTYLIVSIAFLRLRRSEPDLERPFRAGSGASVGILAMVMAAIFVSLYLPIGPSSLKWPYEWGIVVLWSIAGLICFRQGKAAYGNVTRQERLFLVFGKDS